MKILLDECVSKRLKKYLAEHIVYTVTGLGWSGVKNGKLMSLCAEPNFDVLITIDKNIILQQNYSQYKTIIIVFDTNSSRLEHLISFIPILNSKLSSFSFHNAYTLSLK
jgi:predicted nuclease of predicted toxin-antitoxin system